ncbi:MAG TPA: formylglycine-generating enzyme family protein [Candidatus Acidoferrales bacterium]|nr:formylglycine-generating enzyme family protein [Candidatus Acidoferrales bacterium]
MRIPLQSKTSSAEIVLTFLFFATMGMCQTSSFKMPNEKMIFVPGGSYVPFSKEAGEKAKAHVKSFCLDVHQVTNAEFLYFVKVNPQWRKSRVRPIFADKNYLRNWAADLKLGKNIRSLDPVTDVSWFAAQAYCKWAHKRLPTTDEWEYVVRMMANRMETSLSMQNIREWTEDFNDILLDGSQAEEVDSPSILSCGGSSVNVNNPKDYQTFLRYSFRGALRASYCLLNLGFRCACTPKCISARRCNTTYHKNSRITK